MKKQLLNLFLILLFMASQAYAQNHVVTGTITGKDDGQPLPGVSVVVKGTSIGTQTSGTGKYSINVPEGKTVLIFTYVSYKSQEKPITSSVVNVALEVDTKALNEVVVTGVGVATSKRKTAIDVQTVKASDLPPVPGASVDQQLVGAIPGAQISAIDGTPGAKTNIVLRGINTMQSATTPLIMVDGVQLGPGTDISTIDPGSIDRIEVVEGAAGATLYGAQGANGVIQVFTKKGKIGKPQINFTSNYSGGSIINKGNVHQAMFHSFATDASNNIVNSAGVPITLNADGSYTGIAWAYPAGAYPSAMANPLNINNKPYNANLLYYDHIAQLFQTAHTENANFNISGATDKTDYFIGYGYDKQQSAIRGAGDYSRMNLTSNLGLQLFKGFTLRSNTQLIYAHNGINPYFQSGENTIYSALNTSPFFDFTHTLAGGVYPNRLNAGTVSVNGANPFFYEEYSRGSDNAIDIIQNMDANYKINKFVELDAKYGINYHTDDNNQIFLNQSQNINVVDFASYIGSGTNNTGAISNFSGKSIFQNALISAYIRTDFQKDFHSKLPITTSTQLSYDYRNTRTSQYNTHGNGLPLYPIYNMNQTANQQVTLDYVTPFITYGFLANQKVDYGDFGGFSVGIRTDYSSAFGSGSKPFTFPRADAYFRPSAFSFWKGSGLEEVLPEIKFRTAYGRAGIQPHPFDRYVTLNTGNVGNSLAFSLPSTLSNPSLTPEISEEFETGSDLTIKGFGGNLFKTFDLSLTYWSRKGTNVIYQVNTPPSIGGDGILNNAINLSSQGLEISLHVDAYNSKNFNWSFITNFNKQTSTITAINGPPIILATSAGSTALVLAAGQKIGQIYGYKALTSLDQKNQEGVPYIDPSQYGNYQIVDGRVVNINTKGIQFTNEAYSFGDPNPKFNMSLINNFSYKNIVMLSFQFDWVHGSHLYNQTKEWMYRDGISGDFDKPVNIAGQSAAYVAYYRSAYADFFGAQNGARNSTKDYFYEDASFIRLRNISLTFDLTRFVKVKAINRLQLVFTGRNLLTFTKYSGFDPEVSSGTQGSAFDRGVDHDSMPNLKTYQVGLNVGF